MAEANRVVQGSEGYMRRLRKTIPRVLVAIDAPQLTDQPWVVDAIDISSTGMGLVLPEELEAGQQVFLSFQLDDGPEFSRVPALVRHQRNVFLRRRFLRSLAHRRPSQPARIPRRLVRTQWLTALRLQFPTPPRTAAGRCEQAEPSNDKDTRRCLKAEGRELLPGGTDH